MNCAVVAAGDEEVPHAVKRQAARIRQRRDERLHAVIRCDLVERNRNSLAPRTGKRDVNIPVQVHRGIRDGMKIVRDLQADGHGMRRAFVAGSGYAHYAAIRPFRNSRHQPILAGQRNACFHFAKPHHRTRLHARDEAAPENRHLPAGNRRGGRNFLNVRNPVLLCRRAEPEFHTQPM